MPIVAACPYCPARVKVPDHLLGTSFGCPKCGNCFTIVPSEPLPARKADAIPPPPPAVSRPTPVEPPPPIEPPPAAETPWWVSSAPAAAATPPQPEPPLPPPVPAPPAPPAFLPTVPPFTPPLDYPEPATADSSSSLPGWINGWGAIAFTLMALAMLLAAFALPRGLTIGLAALGLLIGLAGAVMPRSQWHLKDGIWLLLGGGGSGLILLAALVRPGWLNERWGMDFTVPEADRNTQMMVSRDNSAEGKELHGEDRVDARTHAIRQGDLLIRIDSAAIERSPDKGAPVLLINLTLANAGQLHDVTYHGQASGDHPAQVRDSRGKELSRRDLGGQAKKMGQVGKVVILPNHEIKDVLAVETPWSGTSAVEVDLPSAAWGREGMCRFTLPANFIVSKDRGK